jgi:hypothetical protein
LSHAQGAPLLPVCSDLSQTTQPHTAAHGVASGTRTRPPGGGAKGPWPTRADNLWCGLSDSQTEPTFAVLGTPCALVRSKAQANRPKFSPILSPPLVP